MKTLKALRTLGIIFGLIGFILLFSVDWRIAVGLFFAMWGDKIMMKISDSKFLAEVILKEAMTKKTK